MTTISMPRGQSTRRAHARLSQIPLEVSDGLDIFELRVPQAGNYRAIRGWHDGLSKLAEDHARENFALSISQEAGKLYSLVDLRAWLDLGIRGQEETVAQSWNLAGTYFETCNCEVACPCVFLSPPSMGDCTVVVGWHVDHGQFNGVLLKNLNVVWAARSPGNMVQGNWKVAVYVDDRATAEQNNALTQIFTGKAGGHPAMLVSFVTQFLGTKSVPIDYKAEGKRRSLRIPGVAEAEIEALSGQDGGEATISGHPLCIAPGHPAVVAKSKRLNYRDYDFHWEVSNRNGFYSAFAYQAS